MQNKSILIIEDEEELLKTYEEYAKKIFPVVFTANTYKDAKNVLADNEVNAILIDNRLPDGLGISLVKELYYKEANIPVILITAYADKKLAIDSVNTGVFYFLEKPITKKKIIDTLMICYDEVIKRSEKHQLESFYMLTNKTVDHLKDTYKMSDREIEVISLALHNYKNTIIAQKLFISTGTVKRHLHNIFEKMEISSKEELQKIIHNINS
ncbi:MAG: response regulator transcription factor [Cyanobacteriota bacterium]